MPTKAPIQIDAGPLPSSAWSGWMCIDSEVEVEAAKGVLYRRLMLRAVQLLSEVYSSCGGGGFRCNVLYPRRSPNFQKTDRAKPLGFLSLSDAHSPPPSKPLPCLTRNCASVIISLTSVCELSVNIASKQRSVVCCQSVHLYRTC